MGTIDHDSLSYKHIAARTMEAVESQAKSLDLLSQSIAWIADALEYFARVE